MRLSSSGSRIQNPDVACCIVRQVGRRIGSRAAKLSATQWFPSNCDSTDYSQFSLGVGDLGLHQMLLLPEFVCRVCRPTDTETTATAG